MQLAPISSMASPISNIVQAKVEARSALTAATGYLADAGPMDTMPNIGKLRSALNASSDAAGILRGSPEPMIGFGRPAGVDSITAGVEMLERAIGAAATPTLTPAQVWQDVNGARSNFTYAAAELATSIRQQSSPEAA